MRLIKFLRWWFWDRPRLNYSLDRAFGWSRWRSLLRCFWPGKKYVYPPHVRREMRLNAAKEAKH